MPRNDLAILQVRLLRRDVTDEQHVAIQLWRSVSFNASFIPSAEYYATRTPEDTIESEDWNLETRTSTFRMALFFAAEDVTHNLKRQHSSYPLKESELRSVDSRKSRSLSSTLVDITRREVRMSTCYYNDFVYAFFT